MTRDWQAFWDKYRSTEVRSEDDLFFQVGKTIARRPIPRDTFASMIGIVVERLKLGGDDHLLDICCGNGLMSFELAKVAKHVTGVDFADHLIKAAVEFKSLPNIDYRVGDAMMPIVELVGAGSGGAGVSYGMPEKFLMNDALAYFNPAALGVLVDNVCAARFGRPFRFLLTGIPSSELKWNFYDTPARKLRHAENVRAGDETNDGLGRWWETFEIESVCAKRGLQLLIERQPEAISSYRMDALIWRE
jgi:SAM-dependent methyltransferase